MLMVDLMKLRGAPVLQSAAAGGEGARERLTSIARGSRVVAAWVLVSRVAGFARIAVAAAVLGPTYFGNLFQFSSAVPFLIYGLLSGSLISAVLVPPLVRCIDGGDQAGARRLANGFLGILMVIFLAITVLGILGAPLLLRVMTVAVQDGEVRREQLRLGWPLMAMMLPQLLFYAVSGVSVAIQQAHGRFALAAAATAVDNLGAVAVVGAFAALYGTGAEIRQVTDGQVLMLGLGTTAAVALCAAVQWWGACRAGLCLVPTPGWRHPEVIRLFRTGASSVGYTSMSIAVSFGMLTVASSVPGGVAAFQIAERFAYLPIALAAGSVAAVQLPQLSRCFHEGLLQEFAATYRSAVRLVLFAMLPASLLLLTISDALAQAAAFGKMAAPAGVALVAACLAGRALGAVGEAIMLVETSASYARRDTASPLQAMALLTGISAIGMVLARSIADAPTLIWTLGATVTVASGVAALYLHWRQTRSLPPGTGRDLLNAAANLFTATAAMGPAWLVVHYASGTADGPWDRIQGAAAATLAAIATYLALQFARGSQDMALLLPFPARLRQRRGARAPTPPPLPANTQP
jgi:putative peptidoglycan lipid II flippase